MLSQAEASQLVKAHLESNAEFDCVVLEQETLEYDFGWVFFYNSREFVLTGDIRMSLAGNAPIIVERSTGRLLPTGTAHPVEDYVKAFREAGDPHASLGKAVKLLGWNAPANAVSAIRAMRDYSGATLVDAKRQVESVLGGGSVVFRAASVEAAAAAVAELEGCGFIAKQQYESCAA